MVRRMLPVLQTRRVGPFVFFDHIGPATFSAGKGMDVRPHPHIGLATVTWLFDGAIRHRDSLGSLADIRPGEVNWMTSGQRHRALRAHSAAGASGRAQAAWHPGVGGAAAGRCRGGAGIPSPRSRCVAANPPARRGSRADRRQCLRRAIAGESVRADVLYGSVAGRRCRTGAAAGTRRTRRARGRRRGALGRAGRRRHRDGRAGRALRAIAAGARGESADAVRRRAAGWRTPPLVELRRQHARADRAGQGRLARRALSDGAGR